MPSPSTSLARGLAQAFLPFADSLRAVLGDTGPAQHRSLHVRCTTCAA